MATRCLVNALPILSFTGMDTTCLYNQLLAGYLGGSPVSTDNYGPLLCVTSDVIRTIVVWHRLNQMPT